MDRRRSADVVDVVEPMGHEVIVHGRPRDSTLAAKLSLASTHATSRAPARVLELTFEPKDLHLFDPASGERLGP